MLKIRILSSIFIACTLIPVSVVHPTDKAYATENPSSTAHDYYEMIRADAQSFHVKDTVEEVPLDRGSYSATTPEEIAEKKRAEEEARKAAEAAAAEEARRAAAEQAQRNIGYKFASVEAPDCVNGLCWPVKNFSYTPENNGFRTASRPNHKGFDMLTAARTPIYSVSDGVVIVSSESHYGFGVAVVVRSVVNGQAVEFTYGHMTYGTRQVQVGDTVSAGQVLGGVGSTGNSTANHLHLEVNVNGAYVDPHAWMLANVT